MSKNYYKRKFGWNILVGVNLIEKHIPYRKCNCVRQLCNGLFIPTHEGQRNCLFDAWENGFIISLPDEEFLKYHKK